MAAIVPVPTTAERLQRIDDCREYYTTEKCMHVTCVPFGQVAAAANNNLNGFKPGPGPEGLQQLLNHPLLLPRGTQGHACRTALISFRLERCGLQGHQNQTWGDVNAEAIQHFYFLADKIPIEQVKNNKILFNGRGGAKYGLSFKVYRNSYIAYILATIIFGPRTEFPIKTLTELREPRGVTEKEELRLKEIHSCFIVPAVHFFLQTMNIDKLSDFRSIMLASINTLHKDQAAKARDFGIWSEEYARGRVGGNLTIRDQDMCKGIYYPYARILALYATVPYNSDMQHVLQGERNTFSDDVTVAVLPPPGPNIILENKIREFFGEL